MNLEAIIGVMIPVLGIVLGCACVMLSMFLDFRRKHDMFELYHAERMAAIEKGIELPPMPEEFFRGRRAGAAGIRRAGLILLFLGGAVTLALWGTAGGIFWWGLVPVGLGLAFLVAALLETREQRQRDASPRGPSAPLSRLGDGT